ncbi:baseplate protein [Bacillus phage vB_BsuM-Goe2]|uniref:Baseplate protein n=1 Tax=Bacillus phage vB_BsuM-Goe2 TaxID=1933062 RepID=A0A217EQL5_9CAUD|nr:baseplate protein [Bacillus phage vB_BsuM-Goe2]
MKIIDRLHQIFNRRSTGDLKHVTDALDQSLNGLSDDLKNLDLQYVIKTATGDWLDEWGSWFNVNRGSEETDEEYRKRILAVVTKPKNTIPALLDAIRSYYNYDPNLKVWIYEPYVNVRRFSISAFSGPDKFTDGSYYRRNIVDIHLNRSVDPVLIKILLKLKSAGVKLYFTFVDELLQDGLVLEMFSKNPPITDMTRTTEPTFEKRASKRFSVKNGLFNLSGTKVLFTDYEKESNLTAKLDFQNSIWSYTLLRDIYEQTITNFETNQVVPKNIEVESQLTAHLVAEEPQSADAFKYNDLAGFMTIDHYAAGSLKIIGDSQYSIEHLSSGDNPVLAGSDLTVKQLYEPIVVEQYSAQVETTNV